MRVVLDCILLGNGQVALVEGLQQVLGDIRPFGLVSTWATHECLDSDHFSLEGRRRPVGVCVENVDHLAHLWILIPTRKWLVTQQRHCKDLRNLEAKLRVRNFHCCSVSRCWTGHEHAVPASLWTFKLLCTAGRQLDGLENYGPG